MQTYPAGTGYKSILSDAALLNSRTPGAHPEGYLEAFANSYRNFATVLSARLDNTVPDPETLDFPSVDEGVHSMAFIDNVVKSNETNEKWTPFFGLVRSAKSENQGCVYKKSHPKIYIRFNGFPARYFLF